MYLTHVISEAIIFKLNKIDIFPLGKNVQIGHLLMGYQVQEHI